MRRVHKSSKSALFLIELIIAIVFFAMASAICVQLFAKAHTLSSGSRNLSMAVNVAQNAAEAFKAEAEPARGIAERTQASEPMVQWLREQGTAFSVDDRLEVVLFDKDWNPLAADRLEDFSYMMYITYDGLEEDLLEAFITVARCDTMEVLHVMQTCRYIPDR